MKLEITRQRNEANEVSIDIDIIINEQKYQLNGYINFQEYEEHIEVRKDDNTYQDLYDFCEEMRHDYNEIKDYIMNNTCNEIYKEIKTY